MRPDQQLVAEVSVLFSEPKIPQFITGITSAYGSLGFSALQRAENSSIGIKPLPVCTISVFQCSSASRKFLNHAAPAPVTPREKFQCSSASRKFLNLMLTAFQVPMSRFSALQRAENSSILKRQSVWLFGVSFSALQRAENSSI